MYSEDEISIVGIIHERELVGNITIGELKIILNDGLGLCPLYLPLKTDLENKGYVNVNEVR